MVISLSMPYCKKRKHLGKISGHLNPLKPFSSQIPVENLVKLAFKGFEILFRPIANAFEKLHVACIMLHACM